MSQFLSFALPGIPIGCPYALIAVGLVLSYRATGVFNFGFGSEAYAAGVIYAELCSHGVTPMLALILVVFVVAPIFGAFLDFAFFSRIPPGDNTAKTILSLGIMVVLPYFVALLLGPATVPAPPSPAFDQRIVTVGPVIFTGFQLFEIGITVVMLGVLTMALRTRKWGLPIRAAVESPKLLELSGVDSKWILRSAWMASTSLAALSGVMIALVYPNVNPIAYSVLLVGAVAAAALGGLRNLPLAVAGGIGLGVVQNLVQGYLPGDSIWYALLVPSLPFFILLLMLIFNPSLRHLGTSIDPMATTEPPPPPPALAIRPPVVNQTIRRYRWPFLIIVVLVVLTFVSATGVNALTLGCAWSIIFLSITLMTGLAGQLSLAQAAFAGIGACATAQLSANLHWPVLLAALVGGAIAAVGGSIASLPALRLRGLPVTLLTLCLALLADALIFPTSWIGGTSATQTVPRPRIFDLNMDAVGSKSFFLLCFIILLAVSGAVHLLIRGTTGRALASVHASLAGASASGVAVRQMTIWVFLLSGFIAGLGGAVFAMTIGQVATSDFNWFYGPVILVIVVTIGATTVEGAIVAGMFYALLNFAMSYLPARIGSDVGSTTITTLLLSVGAFTYASHPEGIGEFAQRKFAEWFLRARPHAHGESVAPSEEVVS